MAENIAGLMILPVSPGSERSCSQEMFMTAKKLVCREPTLRGLVVLPA